MKGFESHLLREDAKEFEDWLKEQEAGYVAIPYEPTFDSWRACKKGESEGFEPSASFRDALAIWASSSKMGKAYKPDSPEMQLIWELIEEGWLQIVLPKEEYDSLRRAYERSE